MIKVIFLGIVWFLVAMLTPQVSGLDTVIIGLAGMLTNFVFMLRE